MDLVIREVPIEVTMSNNTKKIAIMEERGNRVIPLIIMDWGH